MTSLLFDDIMDIGTKRWNGGSGNGNATEIDVPIKNYMSSSTAAFSSDDMKFMLPGGVDNPAEFCRMNFNAEKGKDYEQEIKFMKGK